MRVLLDVDILTNKVYGLKKYTGDGGGADAEVSSLDILDDAEKEGFDIYYENGTLVKKEKDQEEFYNKITALKKEIDRIKSDERIAFAAYAQDRFSEAAAVKLRGTSAAREEKRRELSSLKKERAAYIRQVFEEKLKATTFKHYCSICLIIRDDNDYLEEWLNWHIAQGVEHFYIYDHCSKLPVSEFMKTLPLNIQEKVSVTFFGGSHDFAQHDAYNDCLKRRSGESRWIGYIDSDEMVRVLDGQTFPEFLKEFEGYAGLFAEWITYGASGQKEKSPIPVRERFTTVSATNKQRGLGKVFVQPLLMKQMLTHNGFAVDGFSIVDETHSVVPEAAPYNPNYTKNRICIDHYYTKSYIEWLEKMSRGRCDPYFSRKYDEFFIYNPDMEYCREEIFPEQVYEVFNSKE